MLASLLTIHLHKPIILSSTHTIEDVGTLELHLHWDAAICERVYHFDRVVSTVNCIEELSKEVLQLSTNAGSYTGSRTTVRNHYEYVNNS